VVLPYTHGAIKTSAVQGIYLLKFIHSLLHLQTLIEHWWGWWDPPLSSLLYLSYIYKSLYLWSIRIFYDGICISKTFCNNLIWNVDIFHF